MSKLVEDLISYLNNYPVEIGANPYKYKGLTWKFLRFSTPPVIGMNIDPALVFLSELGREYIIPITAEEEKLLIDAVGDFNKREHTLFANQMKSILGIDD